MTPPHFNMTPLPESKKNFGSFSENTFFFLMLKQNWRKVQNKTDIIIFFKFVRSGGNTTGTPPYRYPPPFFRREAPENFFT